MDNINTELLITNQMGADLEHLPTPRINLSTTEDVRREMGKVYREARSRKIATNEATKLVYMLTQLLKATELYLLEKRLVELELAHLKTIK